MHTNIYPKTFQTMTTLMKMTKITFALCAVVYCDMAQGEAIPTRMSEDMINVQSEQCNMTEQEAVEKVCSGLGLNITLSAECSGCSGMSCDSDGNISTISMTSVK